MSRQRVIGVDVGGTKIAAGLVARDGSIEERQERATPNASEEELLAALEDSVATFVRDGAAAIGFGVPSQIDQRTGRAFGSVNIPLADVPLRDRMQERFGVPVAVENDANAATLAEWAFGAGRHASDLVMLTLGTGVGGGVVVADRLYRGWAELGHLVVEHDGKPCQGACTGRGHVESYCTGVAAAEAARDAFGSGADSRRLVELADQGDERARGILTDIGRRLGSAIGSLVNVFDPQVVAVGGGFGVAAFRFLAGPAREIAEREALAGATFEIVPAELGTRAGLIGAGLVAFEALPSGA